MDRVCNAHAGDVCGIGDIVGLLRGWDDNMKMDFNTRSCENVGWIHLIRRTIIYFRTEKKKDGNILTT